MLGSSDRGGVMPDYLNERERSMEDEYFHKQDQELIEKMRQAAALERRTSEFIARVGVSDPALLKSLQDLGFTPDTVAILPLVPIVEMAWAEGGITPAERTMLISLARQRGLLEGSPADLLLASWMENKPSPDTFARATRLDPRPVRHRRGAHRQHDRRRNHPAQREHRCGVWRHLRLRQDLVRRARDTRQDCQRAQSKDVDATLLSAIPRNSSPVTPVEIRQSRRCRGISRHHRPSFADRSTYSRAADRSPTIDGTPHAAHVRVPDTASALNTRRQRRVSGR